MKKTLTEKFGIALKAAEQRERICVPPLDEDAERAHKKFLVITRQFYDAMTSKTRSGRKSLRHHSGGRVPGIHVLGGALMEHRR